ncbi:MAG: hypothetical protein ACP5IB_08960 [Thermoplasmata archaeon]
MTNGPPPIDDILKSLNWELTEAFTQKGFTRERADKIMKDLMKMISALRPYFARDNPNDIAWIGDYAKIFNEIGEIEKIMDEGEYLRRILNAEMKLYSLVQHKYQEVFPVVSEYVGSEVYPSLFPDSYDISEMSNDEINNLIERLIDEMNEETSQKLHNFVVNAIKRDIYNNKNDIIFFIGPPGSGKSYGALSLASSVDPTFNVDRVVFSVEEFMDVFMKEETDPKTGEKIQKFLPKGSAIVFDDAGVDINAREWQTQQAKIMGKLSQSMRYLNHVIIFTVPSATFIEKQTRTLVKFIFMAESSKIDEGTGKVYKNYGKFKIFLQEFTKEGELLQKYPIITYNHRNIKLKYVTFNLAEKTLLEAYENKKASILAKKYSDFKKEIENKESKKISKTYTSTGKGKDGIPLKCPHCGYEWIYTGNLNITRCPSCGLRVKVVQKEGEVAKIE